jgi:enterochelin esterase-like enzyme
MAVSIALYGPALISLFNGEIDFDTHTIKTMLTTSAYTPNLDTHRYKSSVTNEVTGTGYTAGGLTLSGRSITYSSVTDSVTMDADDALWSSSVLTARRAIVYRDTGTAATSPLLFVVDFGEDVSSSGGPFLIEWDAAGLLSAAVA